MDFTLTEYRSFLAALNRSGYAGFVPAEGSINLQEGRTVLLRHDVDKKPQNSLKMAKVEAEMGFRAIYYFRAVKCSWNESVVKEIAALGHEIGYHYECLTTSNGNIDEAWKDFQANLARMRAIAPITSICMHGSPRSQWDSKNIWKKYDYRTTGVTFEPYLDTDFSKVLYLTDTGRQWDGWKVSVRDKIEGFQDIWNDRGLAFHSTDEVIGALDSGRLPEFLMITTHPQRWTDSHPGWIREIIVQKFKNIIKGALISFRQNNCL